MNQTTLLREARREPAIPCQVELGDGIRLVVSRWLRILPGKRLVGLAEWQGQQVLAKLFIAGGAERHHRRELEGIEGLQAAQLPTPKLLDSGQLQGGGYYLLTEFLCEARSLAESWDQLDDKRPGSPMAVELLGRALVAIGSMHARGLFQLDLHLGNFLEQGRRVYIIDGDAVQVSQADEPLDAEQAQANLALFFGQLPAEWDTMTELLLIDYLGANAHRAINPERLSRQIEKVRQQRMDEYLAKTLRDCTAFSVQHSWSYFRVAQRQDAAAMSPFLANPDSAFSGDSRLKDGGSSTVVKVEVAGRELVVKRYNIKGVGHWLSRFWRPSRAWHSWLAAHRLQFLGLATPLPVAMVERRFGPLRHKAWMATEYLAGPHLLEVLGDGAVLPPKAMLDEIVHLFNQLATARISHGDCKATNFIWHAERVFLIDLDAMQHWSAEERWLQAWSRDRARFLRNWDEHTVLHNWLDEHLPAASPD